VSRGTTGTTRSTRASGAALLTLKPVRDLVLIQLDPTRQVARGTRNDGTEYALYMPGVAQHELPMGQVLALGPDAVSEPLQRAGLVIGSRVVFDTERAIRADSNDTLRIGQATTGNSLGASGPGQVLVALGDLLAVLDSEEIPNA
jgi:co-chaperonin GroES (HSP10)